MRARRFGGNGCVRGCLWVISFSLGACFIARKGRGGEGREGGGVFLSGLCGKRRMFTPIHTTRLQERGKEVNLTIFETKKGTTSIVIR